MFLEYIQDVVDVLGHEINNVHGLNGGNNLRAEGGPAILFLSEELGWSLHKNLSS